MKVVLDSNIFVSSFFWKGNPRKIFDRVTNGLDELYITDEILQEIAAVMSRKKFDTKANEIEDYIGIIESYSIKLFSQNKADEISRDKDDNKAAKPICQRPMIRPHVYTVKEREAGKRVKTRVYPARSAPLVIEP
jgi:putative PIN family toxin of toxin-antitoxin system